MKKLRDLSVTTFAVVSAVYIISRVNIGPEDTFGFLLAANLLVLVFIIMVSIRLSYQIQRLAQFVSNVNVASNQVRNLTSIHTGRIIKMIGGLVILLEQDPEIKAQLLNMFPIYGDSVEYPKHETEEDDQ